MDKNKYFRMIDNYDYVSFDIFDTLIKRDLSKPTYLFRMMEKYATKCGIECCQFAEKRIRAEVKARKLSCNNEVTIQDIYNELNGFYSNELCIYFLELEKKYEISLCHSNRQIKQIYDFCIQNNKNVIITSDMYLDRDTIEKILNKNGIDRYKKLYLSSEYMMTKQDGSLYKQILKELNISCKQIIHIGDNKYSDYIMSRRQGIYSILISNSKSEINRIFDCYDENSYQSLCAFINNHIDTCDNFFYKIGYQANGPLLYGFSKWLQDRALEDNINKLFFLSRDGKILQQAYIGSVENPIDNIYMYGSRRSLIVPMLWKCNSIQDIISIMYYDREISIVNLIKKWGLVPDDYISIINRYGFEPMKKYNFEKLISNHKFILFFNEIIKDIRDNSIKEYNVLVKYLKQVKFEGNVGLVDIGWFGNMQKALQTICNEAGIVVDVYGYYVGYNCETNPISRGIKAKGFLFQYNTNVDIYYKEKFFNPVFEAMFSANHGSIIKFNEINNNIYPIKDEFEYLEDEYVNIKDFQYAGLMFIKDVRKEMEFIIDFNPLVSFYNYCRLLLFPSYDEANNIGELKMKGDDVNFIAKPKSFKHYIKNPISLIHDYKDSLWKIGFLKRLFRVDICYYKILVILGRIKKFMKG